MDKIRAIVAESASILREGKVSLTDIQQFLMSREDPATAIKDANGEFGLP